MLAVISANAGGSIDTSRLTAYCKDHLAAYKVPKIIEVVDEVPKNNNGKIVHAEIWEMFRNISDETTPSQV